MPTPYPSLSGGRAEGQLLQPTNPRENRFFSTRPLFHRYQSRLAEVPPVPRRGGPKPLEQLADQRLSSSLPGGYGSQADSKRWRQSDHPAPRRQLAEMHPDVAGEDECREFLQGRERLPGARIRRWLGKHFGACCRHLFAQALMAFLECPEQFAF